jgi:hypothetical protein
VLLHLCEQVQLLQLLSRQRLWLWLLLVRLQQVAIAADPGQG